MFYEFRSGDEEAVLRVLDEDGIQVIISLCGDQKDFSEYDRNRYEILDHITDDIPDNLTIGFY